MSDNEFYLYLMKHGFSYSKFNVTFVLQKMIGDRYYKEQSAEKLFYLSSY